MLVKAALAVSLTFCMIAAGSAQVAAPQPIPRLAEPAGVATLQPAGADLTPLLGPLQQTAQSMQANLARLRVEKWKTDSGTKQQMQKNVDSLSANVTSALPEIINQVRAHPQSLAASFKLYRNLNVLSDVFSNLSLAADTFAPRSEALPLASDAESLSAIRRSVGDKLEAMAAARDAEVTRLHAQAAAPPPPPAKKIVVDDTESKKAPKKKKPATKPATSQTGTSPTP
jgi:hypothetical protein